MVVTFDFDDTLLWKEVLRDEDDDVIDVVPVGKNTDIFPELERALKGEGNKVYVVTSRSSTPKSVKEVFDYLRAWEVLDHPRFEGVRFTNGDLKVATLMTLGSKLHYDDDTEELAALPPEIIGIQAFPHTSWMRREEG